MTFFEWTKKQIKRDDPVGDLAKDLRYDKEKPKGNNFKRWWEYLFYDRSASKNCMKAFNRAWFEYHEELLK